MIDHVIIRTHGGAGGNGAVTFRREKYVPFGGPDGGDGGRGGDVVIEAIANITTLQEYRNNRIYSGGAGVNGSRKDRTGRVGKSLILTVPAGTIVRWRRDQEGEEGTTDLAFVGNRLVIARGGGGGRGNSRFVSSINRAPRLAEKGDPGEEVEVVLELKLLADVGLVGLPNAGKSSLLAIASGAHPKVDAYPFTTTEPNLGVVDIGWTSLVLADIPGLIEGAHEGRGLGDQFLRHIERTAVLVHILDGGLEDPVEAWHAINQELTLYEGELGDRPQLLAINKVDIPEVREREEEMRQAFAALGVETVYFISAVTGEGVQDLMKEAYGDVARAREARAAAAASQPKEMTVLRPPATRLRPRVERIAPGVWRLHHAMAERLAGGADLSDMSVAAQFWHELGNFGAILALEKAGAQPGDSVRVGGRELIWR